MKTKKLTIIAASYLICSLLFSCSLFFFRPLVSQGASGYEVDIVKAITNDKILLTTYPITSIGTEINITAAAGEYQPASFVVHALQNITGMQASATNLTSGANTIPATAVDIRVVKSWYQAGPRESDVNGFILTPELLLKDDKLVKVDLTAKKNYLRQPDGSYIHISAPNAATDTTLSGIHPQDAATLQPVDIDVNTNKQFWVTVQVPDNAAAGTYRGNVNLSGGLTASVPITLTVLPFTLEKSNLTYSIYFEDLLGANTLEYTWKDSTQYLAEMKDLKAHGVDYPTFYHLPNDNPVGELNLRKQAGLPMNGPAFNFVSPMYVQYSDIQTRMNEMKSFGFTDFYFYGVDEASGQALLNERPDWTAVHQAGGKIFASVSDSYYVVNHLADYDAFGKVGDLLDVAVEAFAPIPSIANEYHSVGHKVFSYLNPQAGPEEPETFRRNFGLTLWKAGYDGAMDYAYHSNFGSSWNDFDDSSYGFRDEMMVYPTIDGVIDTWQWEGFREGVDDVRYLATLQKAIANSTNVSLRTEAQNWLNSLNTSGDLDAIRATMIDYTTQLTAASTYKPEDINQDGTVNTQDLQAAANQILGTQSWPRADVNADGKFDVKDLQRIANVILGV